MKAWLISDLHLSPLEFLHRNQLLVPEADICICAGDIAENVERAVDFLHAEIAPHMPVVAVLGNHDCYGASIDEALDYPRKWTAGTNVHILENETLLLGGLRIVGATLWTDFEIDDHDLGHLPAADRRDIAMRYCMQSLPDFWQITASGQHDGDHGHVEASEMVRRHVGSRSFIEQELATSFNGTTLVLTHHAPLRGSLDPRFRKSLSNAAYASDLSDIIHAWRPQFWVHGHIHRFVDYFERNTRVLCNPKGYGRDMGVTGFRPGFVIETTVVEGKEKDDD
jgi:Icc-related predicted phosphoesterase